MRLRWHREARLDLEESALYLEDQVEGLGLRFLGVVDHALELILKNPGLYPRWPDTGPRHIIQRKVIDKFGYSVAYLRAGDEIRILAIAPDRKRPGYWLSRQADL